MAGLPVELVARVTDGHSRLENSIRLRQTNLKNAVNTGEVENHEVNTTLLADEYVELYNTQSSTVTLCQLRPGSKQTAYLFLTVFSCRTDSLPSYPSTDTLGTSYAAFGSSMI